MAATIRDRMRELEHDAFIGRDQERSLFRSLLTSEHPPHQVLLVHGPGGVGKTTLLREFRHACDHDGHPSVFIDGRQVDATPIGFLTALADVLGSDPARILDRLAAVEERLVLFVDNYERVRALDGWVRRVLLPSVSQHCLVVVADREPPQPEWRSRPGLQALVRPLPLRNFAPTEGRTLLERLGVPSTQVPAVLDFTHGHPLALVLVGDVCAQRPGAAFTSRTAIDVIPTLLARLADEAARPDQRAALEAASIVRSLTEPLLATMLDVDDAHAVFEWLRGLACIEVAQDGLRPHDLVRDALAADLRWRNPGHHATYHERARQYFYDRFYASDASRQQRVLFDLLFLHRDNPMVAPFFDWQATGAITTETLMEGDAGDLEQVVRHHEGDASAAVAAHWFARDPELTLVFRDQDEVRGFLTSVPLHDVGPADREVDPMTASVVDHLAATAPLRRGEVGTFFRFWMATDTYQEVSAVQGMIFLQIARHYLTTPRLAHTYVACTDGDFWDPSFDYFDIPRVPAWAFDLGERSVAVYGHDWRARPPVAWLQLLADRETSREVSSPAAAAPPLVVLSRPDFASAVHEAVRFLHRPDVLARNPLLRSRLVLDHGGPVDDDGSRVAALVDVVTTTVDLLVADPRTARGHRALVPTWLEPAGTQEQVAELLDLPFSTYRRHLREGLDQLTELLWRRELGEAVLAPASGQER